MVGGNHNPSVVSRWTRQGAQKTTLINDNNLGVITYRLFNYSINYLILISNNISIIQI